MDDSEIDGGAVMADRMPSDAFMKALLCHTFGVHTDWGNLKPDGSRYRESEYDKMKEKESLLVATITALSSPLAHV